MRLKRRIIKGNYKQAIVILNVYYC